LCSCPTLCFCVSPPPPAPPSLPTRPSSDLKLPRRAVPVLDQGTIDVALARCNLRITDSPDVAGRDRGHGAEIVAVSTAGRLWARDNTPGGAIPVQELRAADGPNVVASKGGDSIEGVSARIRDLLPSRAIPMSD